MFPYYPILVWYWKKPDDVVGEVSVYEEKSYFFNPNNGVPPYSVDDIIRMTDDFFKGYNPNPSYQRL